jgi:rubrerythrin
MGISFNADEVFEMAERVERDGADFYRRAARLQASTQAGNVELLKKLADMEDQHRATFAAMRAKLPARMRENTAFDPYLEATLYLDAMADSHGGEGAPAAAAALTGKDSMPDILRTAIGLEKKSILFYLGIRDMVPAKLGKDRIEAIIAEEKSHVVTLAAELRKLG